MFPHIVEFRFFFDEIILGFCNQALNDGGGGARGPLLAARLIALFVKAQAKAYTVNNANLDRGKFDMFYNLIDCCAAIRGHK